MDSDIIDLNIGGSFGIALDKDGLIWTWGGNKHGELGIGDFNPHPFPYPMTIIKNKPIDKIACGGSFSICLGA